MIQFLNATKMLIFANANKHSISGTKNDEKAKLSGKI